MIPHREFISLLGGAAAAWPVAARAQQDGRMRRIGVLMSTAADDPEGQARIAAFHQGLHQLGWAVGHNMRIDSRWPVGDRYGISGKWLELLKQIAPGVRRAAIVRDPAISSGIGQFGAIQAVAPSLGLETSPINVRDADEIERAIADFARSPNGGLVITASALAIVHRHLIIALAAKHQLPAVYFQRTLVADGGLISYGANLLDQYRSAAGYVDRILKGEKPADLPVQNPTKYELVINLKTAKALGIEVPPSVLVRADEVIE